MMDIRIYQINSDRDKNRVSFMEYEALPKFQGAQEPNPESTTGFTKARWTAPLWKASMKSSISTIPQSFAAILFLCRTLWRL
jgi:hypothetical protein